MMGVIVTCPLLPTKGVLLPATRSVELTLALAVCEVVETASATGLFFEGTTGGTSVAESRGEIAFLALAARLANFVVGASRPPRAWNRDLAFELFFGLAALAFGLGGLHCDAIGPALVIC
jgi:hypothetical protein